jgi:peroxiredoxin
MPRQNKKLEVGDKAPPFELPDGVTGETVSLESLLGGPLMIMFIRGTW